ncbi:hypothetical protein CC2G_000475 [Coprinopsis cinerea AmutBmut pab1-1]|nr:hypothetical protein CC2G_000475 [Coprinopsis cinerea AmutBmut pab1-1]
MSQFSAELRRKPEWWTRCYDVETQSVWAEEAVDRVWEVKIPSSTTQITLSRKQIQYVLDELGGYAELRDEQNQCQVSCFERIWESYSLLCPDLSATLEGQFDRLRQELVGNRALPKETFLVDPMLCSLIYGRTLVTVSPSRPPRPIPPPGPNADIYTICPKFAMLPSDVEVSGDGTARFLSYINNLHYGSNPVLYNALERLLTRSIPLFEHTLTDLHRNNPLHQRIKGASRYTVWDEPDPPEHSDDEDGWSEFETTMRNWVMNRPIELPDVPVTGYSGERQQRRHVVSLRGRKLQVVTRVQEIQLNPGEPEHPGFEWHVEGMRNERIVACATHFLTYENLDPSGSMEFRMAVAHPRGFIPGDEGATLRTWGFMDGDPCHQYNGAVPLRANLSVSYPNLYQHRISPLRLADTYQPGRVTFVTFLLVDPDIQPIISTANVGPQQAQWIKKALYDTLCPSRLPAELIEIIYSKCDWLLHEEDARQYREEYVDLLVNFTARNDQCYFSLPFDAWAGQ